jgi:hypothetical protein
MDYYDVVIARAREIAERQRQEEMKDNDIQSDSEHGMDTGGVELGDIEIGGIAGSGGLVDQDSWDGQHGQGDSLEDVGSRVGGGITIQGTGTSPRRTRSGKIVKYKDE